MRTIEALRRRGHAEVLSDEVGTPGHRLPARSAPCHRPEHSGSIATEIATECHDTAGDANGRGTPRRPESVDGSSYLGTRRDGEGRHRSNFKTGAFARPPIHRRNEFQISARIANRWCRLSPMGRNVSASHSCSSRCEAEDGEYGLLVGPRAIAVAQCLGVVQCGRRRRGERRRLPSCQEAGAQRADAPGPSDTRAEPASRGNGGLPVADGSSLEPPVGAAEKTSSRSQ